MRLTFRCVHRCSSSGSHRKPSLSWVHRNSSDDDGGDSYSAQTIVRVIASLYLPFDVCSLTTQTANCRWSVSIVFFSFVFSSGQSWECRKHGLLMSVTRSSSIECLSVVVYVDVPLLLLFVILMLLLMSMLPLLQPIVVVFFSRAVCCRLQ